MIKFLFCLAIVLSMFAFPLALIRIIFDGIKESDPDIEID
jgi:hypothetical protein